MYYEPVGYIYEYEIAALGFLAVVMARYFSVRRFPNQKNRLFALILVCTFVDMVLDIVSSLIIDNVFLVPLAVTYLVNELFYLLQICMPLLMTLYTLVLVAPLRQARLRRLAPLFLPFAILAAVMLSNPVTHLLFYVDPLYGYVRGSMFIFAYVLCFFYMGVTLFTAIRNRASLQPNEFSTICCFLAIVLLSILVQYLYPPLLVSGVAMALAVILMHFTIQNPETMLDATTGAFTYAAMLSFLNDRVREKAPLHIVAVEIGNMRRIKELLGLENGNLLLREISRFLLTRADNPWVFRMQDDCFVAVLRSGASYDSMRAELTERIGQAWEVGSTEILVQATICCIATETLLPGPITPQEAVNYLETAFMRKDGAESRIRVVTVGQALLQRIRRTQTVEAALREAMETGVGLELYYQPLWSERQRRFVSAEVLLRFHHREMGDISPAEFVPIAESNGLVAALDELVLRKAFAFIRDHNPRETLGLDAMEINLSALEFMNRRLPDLFDGMIAQYRIDPRFLLLEITETAASESFELLLEGMLALHEKGCRFALDDFGTGYANISQVIRLPFSMVKLDRTLLLGPEVVLNDMVHMFTSMGLLTVIEGVESAAQANLVSAMQVDYVQGYHYARPMCERDFIAFMQNSAEASPLLPTG